MLTSKSYPASANASWASAEGIARGKEEKDDKGDRPIKD
jgi:hypothetical protein